MQSPVGWEKPVAISSCSGALLQSNRDDPHSWHSDVSQPHSLPDTVNPEEGETAEPTSELPLVSHGVYATKKDATVKRRGVTSRRSRTRRGRQSVI